jgi:hypothetical protein
MVMLKFSGNPIPEEQKTKAKKALSDCDITFD